MKRALIFVFMLVALAGCNGAKSQSEIEVKPLGNYTAVDQSEAEKAKKHIIQMEEVIEVKAVTLEKDLYLAVKVKHFDRLRLKKIRQNGFRRLEKTFPKKTIHVSTDKKIFMELDKIEKELRKNSITKKELEKRLKKLDEDMKG
ncbi:MAG TPA: hypothetical protein GX525_02080 [Bacilli bacterium]|nr:hypothetical protein [Bacilli bacterium]